MAQRQTVKLTDLACCSYTVDVAHALRTSQVVSDPNRTRCTL